MLTCLVFGSVETFDELFLKSFLIFPKNFFTFLMKEPAILLSVDEEKYRQQPEFIAFGLAGRKLLSLVTNLLEKRS
jgi:hypothetical protein